MKTIEINGEEYIKKSEAVNITPVEGEFLEIGKSYFVRTISLYYVGRLVELSDKELLFDDASWVASTGRFGEALTSGDLSEIERYPDKVIVNRSMVVDSSEWLHELPKVSV